ncbi:hypothetical protein ACXLRP_003443 [Acinetobacter baumannii]|uniref:hypothetical protein n=1 Tax=Acinetobacter calcoaceticus/baumannii complex TaxID=909768 RepID=UPI00026E1781|nr:MULTISPECIES: hypothetical protein [Acinetobacter calcoaceticus/baumannii complex]ARG38648.1 hypothetical protein B7L35_07215 [Acinetobacter baumannii]EHU1274732.1 hypothetical protein [Acinetobacter baumannii]EHU1314261.1 hypothetical protein [Acinetobacter baumannii]EHU2074804.1 hypothetical protein [Acinetobacter baumannii]EHU2630114.1 hypothetical protein [Acinetobacter baumannii]
MRSWMEEKGWLQGCIIYGEDLAIINKLLMDPLPEDAVLVAASQSCDIANLSEPYIEFSIGTVIPKIDGNFTFNKNPRKLHLSFEHELNGNISELKVELIASKKIQIEKECLPKTFEPNQSFALTAHNIGIYVDWLASRYKRPALPTQFDRRFDDAWRKKKRLKQSESVSEFLIGIYIKIYPEIELKTEPYDVQLLALVVPDLAREQFSHIENLLKQYVESMREAGFILDTEQPFRITTEAKISVATLKQFKRFNLDELSHKHEHPLPSEFHQP